MCVNGLAVTHWERGGKMKHVLGREAVSDQPDTLMMLKNRQTLPRGGVPF
jgi:hypothetical protein